MQFSPEVGSNIFSILNIKAQYKDLSFKSRPLTKMDILMKLFRTDVPERMVVDFYKICHG